MSRRIALALVVGGTMLGIVSATQSGVPAAAGRPHWRTELVSKLNFSSVQAASDGEAWMLGSRQSDGRQTIEWWNGRRLQELRNPPAGLNSFRLAGLSGSDLWAAWCLDRTTAGPSSGKIVLAHWDGRRWSRIPGPTHAGGKCEQIAVAGPGSVWVAESVAAGHGARAHVLLLLWDGRTWQQFTIVPPWANDPSDPELDVKVGSLDFSGPRQGWAVGAFESSTWDAFSERWDGTSWHSAPIGSTTSDSSEMDEVAAVSPRDGWAVGDEEHGAGFVERWNGRVWRQPGRSGSLGQFPGAIDASPKGDVWAVKGADWQIAGDKTEVERWTGSRWAAVSPPPLTVSGLRSDPIDDLAAVSDHEAWLVIARSTGSAIARYG